MDYSHFYFRFCWVTKSPQNSLIYIVYSSILLKAYKIKGKVLMKWTLQNGQKDLENEIKKLHLSKSPLFINFKKIGMLEKKTDLLNFVLRLGDVKRVKVRTGGTHNLLPRRQPKSPTLFIIILPDINSAIGIGLKNYKINIHMLQGG